MIPSLPKSGIDPARTHLVQEFKHPRPLIGCRIDPSGRFVFAGAEDNTIQRWEIATGKNTSLVGHKSWVRGLAAEPADHLLFSGDYAGRILTWPVHAETPKPRPPIEAHRGWVRAVAASPDGQLLVSAGNDHFAGIGGIDTGNAADRQIRRAAAKRRDDSSETSRADRWIVLLFGRGDIHTTAPHIIDQSERCRLGFRD